MNINLKCAPTREQVDALTKLWKGPIEIQMIGHQDVYYLPTGKNNPVAVLHPSLDDDNISVDNFTKTTNIEELNDIWNICRRVKENQGYEPLIVIHNYNRVDADKIIDMVVCIKELNRTYNVKPRFVIENMPPIISGLVLVTSTISDPIRVAKYCNNLMGNNTFGVCLDICHALMAERFWKELGFNKINLEEYFKQYAEYCRLIHWNSCSDLGLSREQHGVPTTREEALRFSDLYKVNKMTSNITIEVREDSYVLFNNSLQCYESMKDLF